MTQETLSSPENLFIALKEFYQEKQPVSSLEKLNTKAWDRFIQIGGLPTRKSEVYRYIKLRNLYAKQFQRAGSELTTIDSIEDYILPECRGSYLVFVNGAFSKELSKLDQLPKKVFISSLADAMRSYGTFLNNHLSKAIKEELDPFALLNMALDIDGAFIYVPPKVVFEQPIQILQVYDNENVSQFCTPRLQFFCGAHSQIKVVSTLNWLGQKECFVNNLCDFYLEDEARVQYLQPTFIHTQSQWVFDATRASLKRGSYFKTLNVTTGSAGVRHDYRINLTAENGEASLNGIALLNGKSEAHVHVLMDHQAPNCRSMQHYKNVLDQASHSSFEGKILVQQIAQKTEAFQLNNNLLLSHGAAAESKPNLEIFADDVKASHGATIGQLDQEQIFYMKTRGFSAKQAESLLVYGYCEETIRSIFISSVFDKFNQYTKGYLLNDEYTS